MTERIGTVFIGGARHYVHPDSGQKAPGVTSILSQLPKPFLVAWASKLAAEYAIDNVTSVADIASRDRQAAIDLVKGASKRFTAKAADAGTEVHDYLEAMLLGTKLPVLSARGREFVPAINDFFRKWSPEPVMTEVSVWGEVPAGVYAGSFDAIVRLCGEVVILDWKTGKGVYPDVAIQLACYRYATEILGGGPMIEVEAAAVVHVRPEAVKLYPVSATREKLDVFDALYRVWQWDSASKIALGRPMLDPPTSKEITP